MDQEITMNVVNVEKGIPHLVILQDIVKSIVLFRMLKQDVVLTVINFMYLYQRSACM